MNLLSSILARRQNHFRCGALRALVLMAVPLLPHLCLAQASSPTVAFTVTTGGSGGTGLALDQAGNIDVVSPLYQNGAAIEIDQLSPQGAVRWSRTFSTFSSNLTVAGVATDPSGNLYVTGNDESNARTSFVLKYDINGTFLASSLFPYQGAPYYPNTNSAPVFDPSSGHLYAVEAAYTDLVNYNILTMEIDPSNLQLLNTQTPVPAPPPAPGNTIFDSPLGIAVDPTGNVYVGDNHYISNPYFQADFVYLIKSSPHLTSQLSSQFFPNFMDILNVAVGPAGDVFVSGYDYSFVGLLSKVNAPPYTQNSGSVIPNVAADAQGNAYALDEYLGVTKYDPQGKLVWNVSPISGGGYNFSSGNAIAVDGKGNVYFTGTSNNGNGNTVVAKLSQASQNSISISTGDQQIGVIGSTVAVPLMVLVQTASSAPVSGVAVNFSISSAPIGAVGQNVMPTNATTASNTGLASTILTLGNIPADYYVAATAAGIASSVTFHTCGKLPNANYQQGGAATWASYPYDNLCQSGQGQARQEFACLPGTLPTDPTRVQIHTAGCALSSLATVDDIYQRSNPAIPTPNDPGTLNRVLPNVNGYIEGGVNFEAIHGVSGGNLRYVRSGSYDISVAHTPQNLTQTATDDLMNRRPVIFHVKHSHQGAPSTDHYITAVGICGGQFIVSDPAGALTLYDPNNPGIFPFRGIRRFSP